MSLLDDIQNGKYLNPEEKKLYDLNQEIHARVAQKKARLQEVEQRIKIIENNRKTPVPPPFNPLTHPFPNDPSPFDALNDPKPELELNQIINERVVKNHMEQNEWDIKITIDALTPNELISPKDFKTQTEYANKLAETIRRTKSGYHAGFRVVLKNGIHTVKQRVLASYKTKEEMMNSPEFIQVIANLLQKLKNKQL